MNRRFHRLLVLVMPLMGLAFFACQNKGRSPKQNAQKPKHRKKAKSTFSKKRILTLVQEARQKYSEHFSSPNTKTFAIQLRAAAQEIRKMGPPAIPVLTKLLQDTSHFDNTMASEPSEAETYSPHLHPWGLVPQALSAFHGKGRLALQQALKAKHWFVRKEAALALGGMKKQAAPSIPSLQTLLKDKSILVQRCGIWALGHLGPKARPALHQALAHTHWLIRREASMALGKLSKQPTSVALLEKRLQDKDWRVRTEATRALWQLTQPNGLILSMLYNQLQHKQLYQRAGAASVLGYIKASPLISAKALLHSLKKPKRKALYNIYNPLNVDDWSPDQEAPSALQKHLALPQQSAYSGYGPLSKEVTQAVLALGPKAFPQVLQALSHRNQGVRLGAIEIVRHLGPKASFAKDALIRALQTSSAEVREGASQALGHIGPGIIPTLQTALTSRNWRVRQGAASALMQMGVKAKKAAPSLQQLLKDRRASVREMAVKSLGAIDPQGSFDALVGALRDRRADIREAALRALSQTGPKLRQAIPALTRAVRDRSWLVQIAAIQVLGSIHSNISQAIPILITQLKNRNPTVRREAAHTLGKVGPKAIQALQKALKSRRMYMRAGAVRSLGFMGTKARPALPALNKALKDRRTHVRKEAIKAIAKVAPQEALVQLLKKAQKGRLPVRAEAVRALQYADSHIGKVFPILLKALVNRRESIRSAAVDALSGLQKPAIPKLLSALRHQSWQVRIAVLKALGRMQLSATSIQQVGKSLRDRDEDVRTEALKTLSQQRNKGLSSLPLFIQALGDESWGVRETARKAITRLGTKASPNLRKALEHKDWRVSGAAHFTLYKISIQQNIPD